MNLLDKLTFREFDELAGAANRVNGMVPEEVEGLKDFFEASPAECSSG